MAELPDSPAAIANGINRITRAGAPWRDLPPSLGNGPRGATTVPALDFGGLPPVTASWTSCTRRPSTWCPAVAAREKETGQPRGIWPEVNR